MGVKAVSGGTFVPSNGAVVTNGSTMPLSGPDGSQNFATVTATVSGGSISRVNLPSGTAVVTNQAGAITVSDADGTQVSCTATIVAQTGQLSFVSVPGTAALVTGGLSIRMSNNGGSGNFPGTVAITGGFINWAALSNTTDTIVADGFSTSLGAIAVSPSTDFATVNVSAGGLQSVGISLEPTKAVVTNAQELTIPVTGTYVSKATLTVAGGAVTAIVLS